MPASLNASIAEHARLIDRDTPEMTIRHLAQRATRAGDALTVRACGLALTLRGAVVMGYHLHEVAEAMLSMERLYRPLTSTGAPTDPDLDQVQ